MTILSASVSVIAVPVLVLALGVVDVVVTKFQDRFGKAADVDLFAPQEAEGL